jgi:hypothetical protein
MIVTALAGAVGCILTPAEDVAEPISDGFGWIARTDDARFVVKSEPWQLVVFPADTDGTGAHLLDLGDGDRERIVAAGPSLLQVVGDSEIAVLDLAEDGASVVERHRVTVPVEFVNVSDGFITVTTLDGAVRVFDRDAFLAGPLTADDAGFSLQVPVPLAQVGLGEATTDGRVVWVADHDGTSAWNLADGAGPLYRVSEWTSGRVALYGTRLIAQSGYLTTVVDVTDPYQPVVVGGGFGGQDIDRLGDRIYGLDRNAIYVNDFETGASLGGRCPAAACDDGTVAQECMEIEATPAQVFVRCAEGIYAYDTSSL